jgi:hypothetical protein
LIKLTKFLNEKAPGDVTEAQVDTAHAASACSPHKSTRHAAQQLNMLHTTVHRILQKCLMSKSCTYQLLQEATAQDEVHYTFCSDFLSRLDDGNIFTVKIIFSNKYPIYQEILIDIT